MTATAAEATMQGTAPDRSNSLIEEEFRDA